jgi:hypothetical protein
MSLRLNAEKEDSLPRPDYKKKTRKGASTKSTNENLSPWRAEMHLNAEREPGDSLSAPFRGGMHQPVE